MLLCNLQVLDFKFPLMLPAHVLLRDILPFVIELFTFCQPDLYLRPAVLKVDLQGNNRVALLRHFSAHTVL